MFEIDKMSADEFVLLTNMTLGLDLNPEARRAVIKASEFIIQAKRTNLYENMDKYLLNTQQDTV